MQILPNLPLVLHCKLELILSLVQNQSVSSLISIKPETNRVLCSMSQVSKYNFYILMPTQACNVSLLCQTSVAKQLFDFFYFLFCYFVLFFCFFLYYWLSTFLFFFFNLLASPSRCHNGLSKLSVVKMIISINSE